MSYFTEDNGNLKEFRIAITVMCLFVALFLIVFFWPFASVNAGNRAVLTTFGKVNSTVLGEGLHLKNPLSGSHEVSLQTQTIDETGEDSLAAASNDLQDVKMEVVANYHLPETSVISVYQQYQGLKNFQTNKLEPAVRESVKSVTAQYTAEELVTKRSEVSTKIENNIVSEFKDLGVVEESFKITNLQFSADFTKAIEAKVTAVQDAEAAKNKLAQVQYEAQQRVAEAQGEAQAIQIQSQAIQANGGGAYLQLQAINKWNGALPSAVIPNAALPFIGAK